MSMRSDEIKSHNKHIKRINLSLLLDLIYKNMCILLLYILVFVVGLVDFTISIFLLIFMRNDTHFIRRKFNKCSEIKKKQRDSVRDVALAKM